MRNQLYIGNLERHLSYLLDDNYAHYVPGNSTVANTQQRRFYQNFGSILSAYSGSSSSYQGLRMSVERRVTNSLSFEANYTFAKSSDEASADSTPGQGTSIIRIGLQAPVNRSVSDFNVKRRFVASVVYALPKLDGQRAYLRGVAGGWQTSGILTLQSGLPFTVFSGKDNSFSGINADHANVIGNPLLDTGRPHGQLVAKYFNTSAFVTNPVGTFGTSPRNFLVGPGLTNLDMAIMKNFNVFDRARLEFRAVAFNLLNHSNFGNPVATVTSPNVGKITSAADPRIMQLALKATF